MFDVLPFINTGEVVLEKNAVIINYTDGLTETSNGKEELFDVEGLLSFLTDNHSKPMHLFNAALVQKIYEFKGEKDFDDDLTLLTFRLH